MTVSYTLDKKKNKKQERGGTKSRLRGTGREGERLVYGIYRRQLEKEGNNHGKLLDLTKEEEIGRKIGKRKEGGKDSLGVLTK